LCRLIRVGILITEPVRLDGTEDWMSAPTRDEVRQELLDAPGDYRRLLSIATPAQLRQRTDGTRWTNQEMLFHLLIGYLVVRTLLPLVWLISRLPPRAGRGFAATLNAAARPFHLVNYVGSVLGGHALRLPWMARLFEASCLALAARLGRRTESDLARTMPFPSRWDPFFTSRMSLLDIYHYPWQHYEFHRRQLTLDGPGL
jgi:hypothetical protein